MWTKVRSLWRTLKIYPCTGFMDHAPSKPYPNDYFLTKSLNSRYKFDYSWWKVNLASKNEYRDVSSFYKHHIIDKCRSCYGVRDRVVRRAIRQTRRNTLQLWVLRNSRRIRYDISLRARVLCCDLHKSQAETFPLNTQELSKHAKNSRWRDSLGADALARISMTI